jgi:hypothetical protein
MDLPNEQEGQGRVKGRTHIFNIYNHTSHFVRHFRILWIIADPRAKMPDLTLKYFRILPPPSDPSQVCYSHTGSSISFVKKG